MTYKLCLGAAAAAGAGSAWREWLAWLECDSVLRDE